MEGKCFQCGARDACELFDVVYRHQVTFCRDFVEDDENDAVYADEHLEFRKDWFQNMEDSFGEYDPDGFEW